MVIIVVMIEGATSVLPSQSVNHFLMIKKSMNPKREVIIRSIGMNSKQKERAP
jgi:hypothetical protein